MASKAAVSVSKRIGKVLLAALCLITAQALLGLASCEPANSPMAARTAPALMR
jgi:hypothetical protein